MRHLKPVFKPRQIQAIRGAFLRLDAVKPSPASSVVRRARRKPSTKHCPTCQLLDELLRDPMIRQRKTRNGFEIVVRLGKNDARMVGGGKR